MLGFYKTAGRPGNMIHYTQGLIALLDHALQRDLQDASERSAVNSLTIESRWIRVLLQTGYVGTTQ